MRREIIQKTKKKRGLRKMNQSKKQDKREKEAQVIRKKIQRRVRYLIKIAKMLAKKEEAEVPVLLGVREGQRLLMRTKVNHQEVKEVKLPPEEIEEEVEKILVVRVEEEGKI